MNGITDRIAEGFIQTFGITRPTDVQKKRAAHFITATLAASLGGVALLFFAIAHVILQR